MASQDEVRRILPDGTSQVWRDDSSCWVTLTNTQRAGEPGCSRDNHIHDACIVDAKAGEPRIHTSGGDNTQYYHGVNGGCRLETDSAKRKDDSYDKVRLLDTAKETVAGRGKNYGRPEDNFMRIANHWEMFLANSKSKDITITPGDVAVMMCLMKIARLENDPTHADSWIDLAGYAACGAEIETSGK